ncbi:MAG: ABC transporter permease [Coriobacteriales bacterium]|nr:ABC transporter permease [Actinomycetes bacterium]
MARDTDFQNTDRTEEHPIKDTRSGLPATPPVTAELLHVAHEETPPSRTLWGDALRRLVRNKLAVISLVWILIVIIAAVTADLWVPNHFGDPRTIDSVTAAANRLHGPSAGHPMGTDELGRDMFGRVVYGARTSLVVGFTAVIISTTIGLLLGAFAGYYGRLLDALIMRTTDVFLAFPYILFSILILAIVPPEARGIGPVILAIGLLGWPTFARLYRGSVLSVKENDYIDAGRALGASDIRLMFRHIAPNAIAPVIVYATMSVGGAILTEAALSFLGLGIQPPAISWGKMIESGRGFLVTNPGLVFWPGLAILSTVLAFTLLGDGVRDALDVKMKD